MVEGWYVIWDYAANKPVSYGRFRPNQVYKYEVDRRDWMEAFGHDVKLIMEASPFRGPMWDKR